MTTTAPGATPSDTVPSDTVLKRVRKRIAAGVGLTSAEVATMGEGELRAWGEALGQVRREVNAMVARVAHGQAELSTREHGPDGIARRNGEPTPHDLVASQTGESEREAKKLIEVGRTLADAEKEPPTGHDGSPEHGDAARADENAQPDAGPEQLRFPHLAQAADQALIGIEAAAMIRSMLERVHDVADPQAWRDAERILVAKAKLLKLRALSRAVRRTEANLFQSGVQAREKELKDARYLHVFEDNTGMIVINGRLDPETAGPIKTALDGIVAQGLQARAANKSITTDDRTPKQMRADALELLARHSLKCDNEELGLASVTMVVRMDMDSLLTAVDSLDATVGGDDAVTGVAEIDGIGQPITAGAARRLAGEAGVVPVVANGSSVALDVGRNRYRFSPGQKLALLERDGGCAMCGAPPSWCEAHHIREWASQAGRTDITNGVMLCRKCHQDLHNQGWTVKATLHETWFTPPASIDPERRPRPGGRMLHDGEILDQGGIERLENAAKSPRSAAGFHFAGGTRSAGDGSRDTSVPGSSVPGSSVPGSSVPDSTARENSVQHHGRRDNFRSDSPEPPLTLCHRATPASPICQIPAPAHGARPGSYRLVVHGLAAHA